LAKAFDFKRPLPGAARDPFDSAVDRPRAFCSEGFSGGEEERAASDPGKHLPRLWMRASISFSDDWAKGI
jgi:hypothetical protein